MPVTTRLRCVDVSSRSYFKEEGGEEMMYSVKLAPLREDMLKPEDCYVQIQTFDGKEFKTGGVYTVTIEGA